MAKLAGDELALKAMIRSRIQQGIGSSYNELSITRQDNLDRYSGELYGYEQEGQSSVVTREVLETVEWAMPSIMRVLAAGAATVEFDASSAADEDAAELETEAVNHIFDKDNEGFQVLYTWVKSTLLNPTAYVKVSWDDSEKVTTETYENLTAQELAELMEDPELEATEADERMMMGDMLQPQIVYDVKFKRTQDKGRCEVIPCPEEEIIIARDHATLDLDDCEFVCHRVERTMSDLLSAGYDKKQLESVSTDNDEGVYNEERVNRRFYQDEQDYYRSENYKDVEKKFWTHECYVLIDWDGDDIVERRKIVMIGNEIFENEEFDGVPIVAMSSILMPHKHIGMSIAELVKDLQEIHTALFRQGLDNAYKVNNPRTIVDKGVNLDDVLSNTPNGYIRSENGVAGVGTEPTTPIVHHLIPMLELVKSQVASRTGINGANQNLNPNVLSQVTNGAYFEAMDAANQRVELVVRLMAETGIKKMMLKIHENVLKYGVSKWMKLRSEWVHIDPRQWRERTAMTVNVGIGFAGRDQKFAASQRIQQLQQAYPQNVTPENTYNAAKLGVESTGLKNVDKYFTTAEKMPKPGPDINQQMIQLQAQLSQKDAQIRELKLGQDGKIAEAKIQADMIKHQDKTEIDIAKEARERAALELQYGTDLVGGMGMGGSPYQL